MCRQNWEGLKITNCDGANKNSFSSFLLLLLCSSSLMFLFSSLLVFLFSIFSLFSTLGNKKLLSKRKLVSAIIFNSVYSFICFKIAFHFYSLIMARKLKAFLSKAKRNFEYIFSLMEGKLCGKSNLHFEKHQTSAAAFKQIAIVHFFIFFAKTFQSAFFKDAIAY